MDAIPVMEKLFVFVTSLFVPQYANSTRTWSVILLFIWKFGSYLYNIDIVRLLLLSNKLLFIYHWVHHRNATDALNPWPLNCNWIP